MDFANRGNRQSQQQSVAPQKESMGAQQTPQFNKPSMKQVKPLDMGKAGSLFMVVASALLVFVLIIGLVFIKPDSTSTNKESALIQADRYQAVFLDSQDGQVYFGKLTQFNKDTYSLTDIYYVRVENPIQPEDSNTQPQANISLAKLGNELHAPMDAMYINRSQVLYWENLEDEGQVVSAIKAYKENGDTPVPQTEQPAETQPAGTPQQNDTPATPATPPAETTAP